MGDRATGVKTQALDDGVVKTNSTEEKQDEILESVKLGSVNLLEVSRGNVDGMSIHVIQGRRSDSTAGEDQLISEQKTYTPLTADTTLYASSTSASDTNVELLVVGMTDDYVNVTRTVTLNGQSQVALSGDMFLVFQVIATGATGAVGDVYIAEESTGGDLVGGVPQTASKIQNKMLAGKNRSSNSLYAIPAGKSGVVLDFGYSIGKNVDCCYKIDIERLGGVTFESIAFEIYQNTGTIQIFGSTISEKTKIKITGDTSIEGATIFTSSSILLIDN